MTNTLRTNLMELAPPFNDQPEVSVTSTRRGVSLRVYLRPTVDARYQPQEVVAAAFAHLFTVLPIFGRAVEWDDQRINQALVGLKEALAAPPTSPYYEGSKK